MRPRSSCQSAGRLGVLGGVRGGIRGRELLAEQILTSAAGLRLGPVIERAIGLPSQMKGSSTPSTAVGGTIASSPSIATAPTSTGVVASIRSAPSEIGHCLGE